MITVETMDSFCGKEKIDRIDILKLDVQGWELEVLRGAKALVARNAIHFIFAEVGFHKMDIDIQQFTTLHEYMEASRFKFCGLYDTFRYGPAKEFVGFSNALYINPHFASA